MTNEMKNKIETELNKVYTQLNLSDSKIAKRTEGVMSRLARAEEIIIDVDGEEMIGRVVGVATKSTDDQIVTKNEKEYIYGKMHAIDLVVTNTDAKLVLETYDSYEPHGWGDELEDYRAENVKYHALTEEMIDGYHTLG